jgi:MFS family permease
MRLRAAIAGYAEGLPAAFWWLWGGALVSALASFVFPFLTLYLTSRGLDAERTGLVVALFGAGTLVAGPIGGAIADRFGRRPTLLTALVGEAVSAAFLGVADAPALLAPGVFLFGLTSGMAQPAISATIADVVGASDLPRAYGLLHWANNLGIGVSAWVGGSLAGRSWLGLFLADATTTLVFAAVAWRRIPETRPEAHGGEPGWREVGRDRVLLSLLAVQFVALLVFWQFQFALPLAMTRAGLGTQGYGRVLALNCGLILLLQPVAVRLTANVDLSRVLAGAAVLIGAGYGAYALCASLGEFALATAVWTLGDLVAIPATSSMVASLAPAALRGRYQGAASLTFALSMMAAPALAGGVIAHAGMRVLWTGCLAVGIAAGAGHLALGAARRAHPTA